MPYIKPEDREKFEKYLFNTLANDIQTCGEFNYFLTKLCHAYLKMKGLNYQNINDLVGAMECCKLELYRRVVGPYENEKANLNGDVFDL